MVNVLAAGGVIGILNGMRSEIVNSRLAAMGSLAAIMGGILAAFVLLKLAHDYIEGQGLTLWSVLRPFVILLCICNFNTFVANPIHGLCNIFTNGMMRQTSVSAAEYTKAFSNYVVANSRMESTRNIEAVHQYAEDIGASNSAELQSRQQQTGSKFGQWLGSAWKGITSGLLAVAKVGLSRMENVFLMPLTTVLNVLLVFVMKLLMFGQQCYCYVYLTIMTLLGPFAFAMAILPSFSHTISSWIARYVQVAFWIPVGQLCMFINYSVLTRMGEAANLYQFGSGWILSACTVVCILNITAVPKIAAYVVDSTGANDAHGNVNAVVKGSSMRVGHAVTKAIAKI